MNIEYRSATRADLAGLLALYRQLNPDDPVPSPEKAEAVWTEIERTDSMCCFVACTEGRIVASCTVAVVPNLTRGCSPYAMIENVITDVAFRRKGIGERVVGMATDFARQRGCYKVFLLSSSGRKDAHRFYESLGFDGNSKKAFDLRLH
jgi:GNAT superfamily N-acetyltransferase